MHPGVLTAELIVAYAAESVAAERDGVDRLTLTAVAHRAGVAIPSLYHHIPSLDGLRREVRIEALRRLTTVVGKAVAAAAPTERVSAYARVTRRFGSSTPGLYVTAIDATAPSSNPALTELAGEWCSIATEALGGGSTARRHILQSSIHGFVVLEIRGLLRGSHVDDAFDELIGML